VTPDADYTALSDRLRRLIADIERYGLHTADTVRRMRWTDLSQEATRKALARAADDGWLVRHPLGDHESYFALGERAISALGIRRTTAPFGSQAILERYAVLLACARRGCDVFTENEFRSLFPELSEPGYSAKNFFPDDSAGPVRLGLFVVDHDKLSSRLVAKVRRRVGKMLATDRPALRRLVLNKQISVHIVTATQGKRANLVAAFARKEGPAGVEVAVEAHPELEDFFLTKRR
jgi:hypothetical protein